VSLLAKIAWVLVAVLAYQVLVGLVVGDDGHEAWSRPLIFAILFPILLVYFYWRSKRGDDSDDH
jgi:cytochrome c oxidase subunit IV